MEREKMEQIVSGKLTISDKIRALHQAGASRAEIARFLERRYQHVRNVLIEDERRAGGRASDGPAQIGTVWEQPSEMVVEDSQTVTKHRFFLRPDFAVEIALPTDLTAREAQRLAQFIGSVPL
ncbi:hypothetical protein [Sphingomonas sp.]|uniref:hypothetical protein n=1 Tax=Sphingomonas sp. TaxID=28214 RepID=UPI001E01DD3D|nr:hypothetical protein [Sphingomonas sp.]MBX9795632.1 hypothetical protein [Sphingomonas sp.]